MIPASRTPAPAAPAIADALLAALRSRVAETPDSVVRLSDGGIRYHETIRRGREPARRGPEETVRALVVMHLVHDLGYRPANVRLEYRVRARAGRDRRDEYADLVILRRQNGAETVYCLIECRTPDRYRSGREAAFESRLFGLNRLLYPTAEYLACGSAHTDAAGVAVVDLAAVNGREYPTHRKWKKAGRPLRYDSIAAHYGRATKAPRIRGGDEDLKRTATPPELSALRTELHDVLWGGGGQTDADVFNLLMRLLLAKIQDEQTTPPGDRFRFRVAPKEGVDEVLARLDEVYRIGLQSRLHFTEDQAAGERLRQPGRGTDAQIRFAIERLEPYDFTAIASRDGQVDFLGDFFEGVMRTGYKQTKGQFFTHRNIADFLVRATGLPAVATDRARNGQRPPRVIDPAAGSGTFLIAARHGVRKALLALREEEGDDLSVAARTVLGKVLQEGARRRAWTEPCFFGLEIDPDLGFAARVNLLLHADGASSIFAGPEVGDGLAPFSEYAGVCPLLAAVTKRPPYTMPVCEQFDFVLSNPPFSARYSPDDRTRYDSALEIISRSHRSEDLFVERWFQLLRPGGRLGAVVPNSLLDARKSEGRDFLLRHFRIRAVVSLPPDAFYPHTGTKTSLVVAQKKTAEELRDSSDRSAREELLAHDFIPFAKAGYLGYRRTSRREYAEDRNDLDRIAGELEAAEPADPIRKIAPADLLAGSPDLRLDADFALHRTGIENPVSIGDLLRLEDGHPVRPGDAEFYYCEIGHIGRLGDISPMRVPAAGEEIDPDLARPLERTRKKVEAGKVMRPRDWTLLVPRIRPDLGKFAVVTGCESNLYFTTDLYALAPGPALLARCGGDRGLATCALLLSAKKRGELQPVFGALPRWGKGYPVLREEDLRAATIAASVLERATTRRRLAAAARLRNSIRAEEATGREIRRVFREAEALEYGGAAPSFPVVGPPETLGTGGEAASHRT